MTKESMIRLLHTCPICGTTYQPDEEVCKCPEPEQEEPKVENWEDVSHAPAE